MNKERLESSLNSRTQSYEERRKKVGRFNMTSDVFFCKVLEDKEACEEAIRILLYDPGFTVKEVKAQYSIRNIENRSVVLDILAEDMEGRLINIEMQMSDDGDHQKRVRYYQASIDMSYLEKGVPYHALPDIYMIFITEKDFLAHKRGMYRVSRVLESCGSTVYNGVHEIYANLECRCGDEKIDELLYYMKNSNSDYKTDTFPNIVRKVRYLKEKKEGLESMCSILDEERKAGIKEGRKAGIKEGIEQGIKALILDNREEGKSREQIIEKLSKRFMLSREEAEKYYDAL